MGLLVNTHDLNDVITAPVPGAVVFSAVREKVGPGAPASHTFAAAYRTGAQDGRGTPSPHAAVMTVEEEVLSVPTVSEWGLVVLTLLTLAAGTLYLQRRAVSPNSTM